MPKSGIRVRNPVIRAASSLMAKGGAHGKSASVERRQVRQAMNDEVEDYLAEREMLHSQNNRGRKVAPGDQTWQDQRSVHFHLL